jgi:hypothetical protein
MSKMIARCGFQCHACLAFSGINKTPQDQEAAARAWKKYYGLVVPAAEIRCNGCLSENRGDYRFPEPNCHFSACVRKKRLGNCAACSEYPCRRLESRMEDCDGVCEKFRDRIPRAEFRKCIAPYDMRSTLESIKGKKGE